MYMEQTRLLSEVLVWPVYSKVCVYLHIHANKYWQYSLVSRHYAMLRGWQRFRENFEIKGAEKPQNPDITAESPEFKFWIARWEILEIKNGFLCILWEDNTCRWRICAPKSVVKTTMWHLHISKISVHLGIKKISKITIMSILLVGNDTWCQRICTKMRSMWGAQKPLLQKAPFIEEMQCGGPFERIATDIAGPFPTTDRKHRYILVIGDYFTKLTEAYPMENMLPETVADILFRAWVKRYCWPSVIHSDQGRQYESELFTEVCKLYR